MESRIHVKEQSGAQPPASRIQPSSPHLTHHQTTTDVAKANAVRPQVKEHHRFEVLDAIFEARVPILRMRFDGALEVGMEASVVASLGEGEHEFTQGSLI